VAALNACLPDYAVWANPAAVEIADVNRDGLPDLVVSDHAGSAAVLPGRGFRVSARRQGANGTPRANSPRRYSSG
jgi:hypothetical protein